MSTSGRGPGRGTPLWLHLCGLAAVPLAAVGVLSASSAAGRSSDVQRGTSVVQQVREVRQIDRVRSAAEREVLPTLLVARLQTPGGQESTLTVGTAAQAGLRSRAPSALRAARAATDRAFAAVPDRSPAARTLAPAQAQLRALREEADGRTVAASDLARAFLLVTDGLAHAERDTVVGATANGLSPSSSLTSYDLLVLVQLDEAAGSQLPLLFAAHVSGAPGTPANRSATTAWLAALGSYTQLRGRVDDLSDPGLRTRWRSVVGEAATTALDERLADLAARPQAPLAATDVLSLQRASTRRDDGLSSLLSTAVDSALRAALADRAQARERMRVAALLAVLAMLVLVGSSLVLGVVLTRSLRSLATAAQRISLGDLVDVPASGPREARTVARALGDAVAGLRRVRDQALAVARGDLTDAVLDAPLPGPLGEVVHASVQRIVSAVRAREVMQAELAHQVTHDALTGLASRSHAVSLARAAMARCAGTGSATGLMFLDLDRFKQVNDTLGHACGDAVLQITAQRLLATVPEGGVVGRLGGDEFVVVVPDPPDERSLVALAERLVAAISEPVLLPAHLQGACGHASADVGASIGVAVSRDGSLDVGGLLHEADVAVYRAKHGGRGRVEVFDDALRAELAAHDDTERALREAVAGDGLHLHYQPVVDVATGALDGFEALCRWDRPGTGPVPPDVFVPVAEESDLVIDLGRWVLGEATRQLAVWSRRRAGALPSATPLRLGINLSGRHLADPRVVDDVAAAVAASGVLPGQLVLEITETVLVDDPVATEHLHQLRALGCLVAIDDFGTGYTSIGQLGRMPTDVLKIDRSFVASDSAGDREIVALAIAAAHTLGLVVVAEGAEEPAHLARLREVGCDLVQGYLLSRPLPAPAAGALVTSTLVPGADQGKSIHDDVSRQAWSGVTTERGLA